MESRFHLAEAKECSAQAHLGMRELSLITRNNVDLRGAFDYETPPTGEMVMVIFFGFKFMFCLHTSRNRQPPIRRYAIVWLYFAGFGG